MISGIKGQASGANLEYEAYFMNKLHLFPSLTDGYFCPIKKRGLFVF